MVGETTVGARRGVNLQVAVTSVIASYFPLQRKIVFIMCHAHSARQGPLESIPKSQREEALHLNSRLASNEKGEKEQGEEVEEEEDRREGRGCGKNRGSSSLTVFEQQQTSVSSCTRTQAELIPNISVTRGELCGFNLAVSSWRGFRCQRRGRGVGVRAGRERRTERGKRKREEVST